MPSLSPGDVGRRVVVRHRIDDVPGVSATDVIGVLEAYGAERLVLRRTDGEQVEVPTGQVLAAKVIPPRSVTRREVRHLEAAAARGWPGLEVERLGEWLLRAGAGFTGRANSCLPLGDSGRPLDVAVDEVERWYLARGLSPRFQVPEPIGGPLTAVLDARRWVRFNPVLVLTAPVADIAPAVSPDLPDVVVVPTPDDAWLSAYHYRGGALPAGAREVLECGEGLGFGSVREGDTMVAVARGAVTDAADGRRWLGVTAVEVVPGARRRGLGSHVVAALATWAAERGATDVYLQVAEENGAARAAYGRMGFVEHHRYHYRRYRQDL